jgi:hypothetical protein
MITVFTGCIFLFILFFSIGFLVYQNIFYKAPSLHTWLLTFFIGMLACNTVTSVFSIFYKAQVAFYFLTAVALIHIISNKLFKSHFKALIRKVFLSLNNFYGILLFFALLSGIKYPYHPDSWLYHIQSIKWLEEFPFIPGLGNLHERFAFNPGFFSLCASFTLRNVVGQPVYLINLVTYCSIIVYLLNKINQSNVTLERCFQYGFLILGLTVYSGQNISSPSHDLSSLFYFVPVVLILVRRFSNPNDYEIAFIFSIAAIINKIIFFPVAFLIVLSYVINFRKLKVPGIPGVYFKIIIFSLLILLPWLYSSYILSGYLFFPLYKINIFNPDWKIPIEVVKSYQVLIKEFAARNGQDVAPEFYTYSYFQWFIFWLKTMSKTGKLYTFFIVISIGLIFILSLFRLVKFKLDWQTFGIALVGLIFVMFFGPDIRYLFPYLLLLVLSFNAINLRENLRFLYSKCFSYLLISLYILLVTYSLYKHQFSFSPDTFLLPNTNKNIIVSINSGSSSYPIGNNITVTVPFSSFCFDDEIPCGIEKKNISLRTGSLKDGFKAISGPLIFH